MKKLAILLCLFLCVGLGHSIFGKKHHQPVAVSNR